MIKSKYTPALMLLIFILVCNLLNAQTKSTKEEVLKNLRSFRDSLNTYPRNIYIDSLIDRTTETIYIAKTCKDEKILLKILDYYLKTESIYFKQKSSNNKGLIAKYANQDLLLKLHSKDPTLPIESFTNFGTVCKVRVKANTQFKEAVFQKFRLYWATYRGGLQEAIINTKKYEGSSNELSNPYTVEVLLPGYITFWIEDTDKGVDYKSDFVYKRMNIGDSVLEVNFRKLK